MRLRNYTLLVLAFGSAIYLGSCVKALSENDVAYVIPLLDNIIASIRDSNYEMFSRDLNAEMKGALDQNAFAELKFMLDQKLGDYQGRNFTKAIQTKKNDRLYTTVLYTARYTKEPASVVITITTEYIEGQVKIGGLYFNSPSLRSQ